MLLHDTSDFADLLIVTGRNLSILPALVEKDYVSRAGLCT